MFDPGIEREQYYETMKRELQNVVDWLSSNELLLNLQKRLLTICPHHKKFYTKAEHDMVKLHEITPNLILNKPCDTPEDHAFNKLNKKK